MQDILEHMQYLHIYDIQKHDQPEDGMLELVLKA